MSDDTRRVSAAVFGNEKTAEVVAALAGRRAPVTAQEVATALELSYSLARDVLIKLAKVGVIRALPKIGGTRSAQYYEPVPDRLWQAVVELSAAVIAQEHTVADLSP